MPAEHFARAVALDALGARVPARDAPARVEQVDRVVGNGRDHQPELLVARVRGAGGEALGDV
jgi:hypothetical protein